MYKIVYFYLVFSTHKIEFLGCDIGITAGPTHQNYGGQRWWDDVWICIVY